MWMCTPPSSTIRRASAAYSSDLYGIAGHCSRLASEPEIEQVMTTGSSRLTGALRDESGTCHFALYGTPSDRRGRPSGAADSGGMPSSELRASDADRERAVDKLDR